MALEEIKEEILKKWENPMPAYLTQLSDSINYITWNSQETFLQDLPNFKKIIEKCLCGYCKWTAWLLLDY